MAYRRDADRVIAHGTNAEKKRLLAAWIDKIQLAPETLEVEIRYKIPEPVVDGMGAGAWCAAIHNALAAYLVRRWVLPRKGRRSDLR